MSEMRQTGTTLNKLAKLVNVRNFVKTFQRIGMNRNVEIISKVLSVR